MPVSATFAITEPQEVISTSEKMKHISGPVTQCLLPYVTKGTKSQSPGPGTDRDPEEVGLVHGIEDDLAQRVVEGVVEVWIRWCRLLACSVSIAWSVLAILDAVVGIPVELAGSYSRPLVVLSLILLWRLENKETRDTKL